MTIQTQAKPKKRSKYRPVERPDGVVVLQRPYHPATLPAPKAPKFEKHVPTFAFPQNSTSSIQRDVINRRKEDLAHIGSERLDMGRGGYNEVMQTGRDGYNDVMQLGRGGYNDISEQREDLMHFLEGFGVRETSRHMTPMQRFLNDAGPWSTHELHQQ